MKSMPTSSELDDILSVGAIQISLKILNPIASCHWSPLPFTSLYTTCAASVEMKFDLVVSGVNGLSHALTISDRTRVHDGGYWLNCDDAAVLLEEAISKCTVDAMEKMRQQLIKKPELRNAFQ